jgi:hypothetical protein
MAYDDDNDLYISIANFVITLMIIGIVLYLYIAYKDLKTKTSNLIDDYKKKVPYVKS